MRLFAEVRALKLNPDKSRVVIFPREAQSINNACAVIGNSNLDFNDYKKVIFILKY